MSNDMPGKWEDEVMARAMKVVGDIPTPVLEAVRAGMSSARKDPDYKAEAARYAEYLDVDQAMLFALVDDSLEYHQAGRVEEVILTATRQVRYTMDLSADPKRICQLVLRLARMLYMEQLAKFDGDRDALMQAIANSHDGGPGIFAPDALNDFKIGE